MTAPTTLCVSRIQLSATPTAVGMSRAFVRQMLRTWQLADFTDSAELIVSELVTNAVRATGSAEPCPKWQSVTADHVIGVQLRLLHGSLFIEVWDRGDGRPAVPEQSDDAECGRGLFLVRAVSEKWGVHRPDTGGKVVWAKLTPESGSAA
ncbi:ATP-binding protein [Streptomyces sp. CA-111067]|uniref:ATP-binding protein n=1 Tax=Streptomyces sp. CA-111067 TaxID=3240046 RepID=UPI003D968719